MTAATEREPQLSKVRPVWRAVYFLLAAHVNGEIVSYEPGLEVPWDPAANPLQIPKLESPWVSMKIRWWCSICSAHVAGDDNCPRCAVGHWATTDYAIWRNTGDVYRVGDDGAVGDDPYRTGEQIETSLPEWAKR